MEKGDIIGEIERRLEAAMADQAELRQGKAEHPEWGWEDWEEDDRTDAIIQELQSLLAWIRAGVA